VLLLLPIEMRRWQSAAQSETKKTCDARGCFCLRSALTPYLPAL
jgi:hypothetical protein